LVFATSALYFAWGLDRREINVLEAQDFGIASDLFHSYGLTPDHSPLHFVFLNLWQRLDQSSVAFLRLPSVVFCALAVVVVSSLAGRIAGQRAALASAALFATNPLLVDNARSMRMYGLAVLAAASVMWFAHAYLMVSRRRGDLACLALSVTFAVYNHLFAWLLVGSIGLVFVFGRWNFPRDERRRLLKWALGVGLLLLPQLAHVFLAVGFVHERHALYQGLDSGHLSFLTDIARTLFFGETAPASAYWPIELLAPVALVVAGVIARKRMGARTAAALFLPALVIAWALGRSNPIEARYLNYLLPALGVFMGIGAAHLASRRAWLWGGVVVVLAISCHATFAASDLPPTDWYTAVERIRSQQRPDDVIAIFPDFWRSAFRRYGDLGPTVAVNFPADLERVLAENRRVVLVALPGREFGSMDALLHAHARTDLLFRTTVREPLAVYSLVSNAVTASPGARDSLLLVGVVGSGGYAWQTSPDVGSPFGGLSTLFANRLVIAGYEPYWPPWVARIGLGGVATELLRPNLVVTGALAKAGVGNLVAVCRNEEACTSARATARAASIELVPEDEEPRVESVAGTKIATVSLTHSGDNAEKAIARGRDAAGREGRVVVFVPAVSDYGRLATTDERAIAHHLIDLGADVVAGMGGWAAKEVEPYGNGVIAYSLGALLRAPNLSGARQESSGIALNLTFPGTGRPVFDVIPLTFDDRDRPTLGRLAATRHLVFTSDVGSLSDQLATAEAFAEGADGVRHDLGPWQDATHLLPVAVGSSISTWFPLAPPSSQVRPVAGFFGGGGGAYVARRGVLDLGEYHRAIELDPAGVSRVAVSLRNVPLSERLAVAFGLPDDRLRSKYAPLHDQRVTIAIGEREVLSEIIPYRIGFRRISVDTREFASARQVMTIAVHSNGTHFPIAVAASPNTDP
jgi:hypothetical protein